MKLRKYVTTVSQIVDMNQSELGRLASHLGHDIQIHKDFYRLQESIIEMALVGNLLVAVDEGKGWPLYRKVAERNQPRR